MLTKAQVCQWGEQTREVRLARKHRILKWKKNEQILDGEALLQGIL